MCFYVTKSFIYLKYKLTNFLAPRKFSDPDYLKHWTPFSRQGGNATRPVTEIKL